MASNLIADAALNSYKSRSNSDVNSKDCKKILKHFLFKILLPKLIHLFK